MLATLLQWLLAFQSTAAPPSISPPTCVEERGPGLPVPAAGVELYPGVTTGMTRDQVKAVNPKLVAHNGLWGAAPVKGLHGRGGIYFDRAAGTAALFWFESVSARDKVEAMLRARYGEPLKFGGWASSLVNPVSITGGTSWRYSTGLCWRDGPRQIQLSINDEGYFIRISVPAVPPP